MTTIQCPECHRWLDIKYNTVMLQCRCGQVVYDRTEEVVKK
jgi:hypothetical protein